MMRVQVFDWLKGDGNAWIDLNRLQSADEVVRGKAKHYGVYTQQPQMFDGVFGALDTLETTPARALVRRPNGKWAIVNFSSGIDTITDDEIVFEFAKDYVKLNNNTYTLNWREGTSSITEYLFNRHRTDKLANVYSGSIAYYEVVGKLLLKPCKLLASYGNHPIGECCMINVLDNTLFFNEGSGAFSVEGEALEVIDTTPCYNNIISKESTKAVRLREWIVCNRYQYIAVPKSKNVRLKISTQGQTAEFGFVYGYNGGLRTYKTENLNILRGDNISALPFEGEVYIDIENRYAETNETRKEIPNDTIEELSREQQYLFGDPTWWKYYGYVGKCGEVVANNYRLHPAELALPYGAHQIGEACMIDLLNGDLYFNQGSGSFSCEGAFLGYWQDKPMENHYCDVSGALHRSVQIFADNGERLRLIWEKNLPFTTHKWLVGDGVACMDAIPLSEYDLKIKPLQPNLNAFSVYKDSGFAYQYSIMTDGSGQIYFNKTGARSVFTPKGIDAIKATADKISINGTDIADIDTTEIDHIRPFPNNRRGVYWLSKLTDNIFPAILDRPTLASEDNNNIARKQGEAVFVDEERYKQGLPWCFGNVASSGSFSVSDYLIENEDFEVISGVKGSAEIDFITIPNYETISAKIKLYPNGTTIAVFGGNGLWSARHDNHAIAIQNENGISYFNYGQCSVVTFPISNYTIDYNAKIIDCNGFKLNIPINGRPINVFVADGLMSVKTDTLNLIPVRLKKPIEPYTTHNNKGGSEGEYCFFDTISGRAYTNDGSGKFRRYFEEGVDYERVAGVVSNSTKIIHLPCGIVGLSYTVETLSGIVGHADVISDDNGKFCIINYDANNVAFNHNNGWNGYWQFAKDEKHEYTFKYDGQYINGVSWAPVTRTNSGNASIGGFCVIKSVKYDGVIDLIPIRLLKKAYSTDTHNGREYKEGTICFYDQVSGMVYGNDGEGDFSEYVPS